MIRIFPGKTAVCVSCPYSKEHSCRKAKKSLARFSVTFRDGRTDGLTFPGLTSTEVENCSLASRQVAQRQKALDFSSFELFDFSASSLFSLSELSTSWLSNFLSSWLLDFQTSRPNLRKWPKLLFCLFGSFKNALLCYLNDPSWTGNIAESWKTFSTITICNIKSIQQTKL